MELFIAFIVGWCGTGWPLRLPPPGGWGGGIEPGDWPPNCPMCGRIVGGLAGLLVVLIAGSAFAGAGLFGTVALAFFGGSFGNEAVLAARNAFMNRG